MVNSPIPMFAHNRVLLLTPQARQDLEDIAMFTETTWGLDQADHYESLISQAVELILEHPYMGQARDDLRSGLRSRPVERHIVYYQVNVGEIEVFRVLHQRVDPSDYFQD